MSAGVAPVATLAEDPTQRAPLLEARDLRVTLGGQRVLDGASLRIAAGEVVGLVGRNGAGKSTLLRVATGVWRADGGTVLVGGEAIERLSTRDLARRIAVVQQLPEAPATLRVRELALLGRHPHLSLLGRESTRDHAIAEEAMRRAGCADLADRELGTLSGGERRRAFIARALAQQCPLLMLDEPTANLDAGAQGEVLDVVAELAEGGTGVLLIVHDLTLAAAYCTRVAVLDGGRVVADGPPSEVVTDEIVRRVYGPGVAVIPHPRTGAPLIVPSRLGRDGA